MTDAREEYRDSYRPSGKVAWFKFFAGVIVTAGTAVVMAWCLFFAYWHGFYLILLAPFIASVPVAGVWYAVLAWSHCRNRWLAAAVSLALALLLYFGYYYLGLLQLLGTKNAHRLDLLPSYIEFRMHTDVAMDVGRPNANAAAIQGPDRVQQVFNWVFFGSELLIVIGVLVTVGQNRSAKAYCELCGRWTKSETLKLAPGTGPALWDALQREAYADARQLFSKLSPQQVIGCNLTIEHCSSCPTENRSPTVYLTIKDVAAPGASIPVASRIATLFKPRGSMGLHTLVDHVALRPEETGALASTFPALSNSIAAHPDLFAEVRSTAEEIELAQDERFYESQGRLAQIEAVEPHDAGTILTRKNAILQTVIAVIATFGGFALAFGPAGVLLPLDPPPPDWVLVFAVIWVFLCLALNLLWILCAPMYFTARFMLRLTRRAFEFRANPAVDLHNPDLFFVDIIPRINWGKQMMENATDIGFLELNKARRELIFEGDRERYRIPVESILSIKREFWCDPVQHQLQTSPTKYHAIVVRAMTADGPWETWFYQRQKRIRLRNAKHRLADAVELESKIQDLVGRVS